MVNKKLFFFITVLFQALYPQSNGEHDSTRTERIPYSIPLVKLALINDSTAIRITKNDEEYAIIGQLDDILVKNKKNKKMTITIREPSNQAQYLSEFEARYMIIVTRSLITTLEEFERNLQKKKWGQCLYLDAFLPKFLRNFYLLLGIVRNDASRFDDKISMFEKKYEVSLNSQLSDRRVALWEHDENLLMKLRIASKEIAHQLSLWEDRELSNKNRNFEVSLSGKVEESLELFIKIYFGINQSDDYMRGARKKVRKRN